MISCKKATELISKDLDKPLSTTEALLLKMHLFLCETCDLFRKQTALMRKALRRDRESDDGPKLREEAKDRIRRSIGDCED